MTYKNKYCQNQWGQRSTIFKLAPEVSVLAAGCDILVRSLADSYYCSCRDGHEIDLNTCVIDRKSDGHWSHERRDHPDRQAPAPPVSVAPLSMRHHCQHGPQSLVDSICDRVCDVPSYERV